jgi:GAF domain-containing protein
MNPNEDIGIKLEKLSGLFNLLGSDPQHNIDILVEGACTIVQGACALYNRLDDATSSLCTWSIHNRPPDYCMTDSPSGHICYEATIQGQDKPVVISNLEGTVWETSDANVKKFGLKSYIGYPVQHRGKTVGSLCVVDVKPREFSASDVLIINILAKAMSVEEERKHLERELEDKLKLLEQSHSH